VTPAGARVYILPYSRRDRTRRVTIGKRADGGLTADQARREAEILRGIIRDGGDPATERARQCAIPTKSSGAHTGSARPTIVHD
jgi:hypothetical protein